MPLLNEHYLFTTPSSPTKTARHDLCCVESCPSSATTPFNGTSDHRNLWCNDRKLRYLTFVVLRQLVTCAPEVSNTQLHKRTKKWLPSLLFLCFLINELPGRCYQRQSSHPIFVIVPFQLSPMTEHVFGRPLLTNTWGGSSCWTTASLYKWYKKSSFSSEMKTFHSLKVQSYGDLVVVQIPFITLSKIRPRAQWKNVAVHHLSKPSA